MGEAEFFVDGAAEFGGVEGDDLDVLFLAEVDGVVQELGGEAAAAGCGGGIEVEEIGADGVGVEEVRGEVGEEDAAGGEEGLFLFEEKTYVAAVGEAFADPGLEGLVHGVVDGFGGEFVVSEHLVALGGDEGGVVGRGVAEGGHRTECRA